VLKMLAASLSIVATVRWFKWFDRRCKKFGHKKGPRLHCLGPAVGCYLLKLKFARWTLPSLSFITNCLQPLHVLLVAHSYS
jgi:hypothetical protein